VFRCMRPRPLTGLTNTPFSCYTFSDKFLIHLITKYMRFYNLFLVALIIGVLVFIYLTLHLALALAMAVGLFSLAIFTRLLLIEEKIK